MTSGTENPSGHRPQIVSLTHLLWDAPPNSRSKPSWKVPCSAGSSPAPVWTPHRSNGSVRMRNGCRLLLVASQEPDHHFLWPEKWRERCQQPSSPLHAQDAIGPNRSSHHPAISAHSLEWLMHGRHRSHHGVGSRLAPGGMWLPAAVGGKKSEMKMTNNFGRPSTQGQG